MILNNLMQAVKKLEHIRDMVKALVLTGFKQGKVEFTDADVIAIKQVIAFIKMGTLPEQITAQINEVASPDEDTQEPASPLPPIETVKEIIHRQLLPIIEEFDPGDGVKHQIVITAEDVHDSGKEPKTHNLVESPSDDWKDGIE